MLKKFTITAIFYFSLCLNIVYSAEAPKVFIVYADDISLNHSLLKRAARNYNKSLTDVQVVCQCVEDGSGVILSNLVGVSALFLDISMGRENGNLTLVRLREQAAREKFVLPPCVAVTTEDDYLLENGSSKFVTGQGFLFARDKISGAGLQATFDRIASLLDANWLIECRGRYEALSACPSSASVTPFVTPSVSPLTVGDSAVAAGVPFPLMSPVPQPPSFEHAVVVAVPIAVSPVLSSRRQVTLIEHAVAVAIPTAISPVPIAVSPVLSSRRQTLSNASSGSDGAAAAAVIPLEKLETYVETLVTLDTTPIRQTKCQCITALLKRLFC